MVEESRSRNPRQGAYYCVWTQGSVLSAEAVTALVAASYLPVEWQDSWVVAVSHSCDLASADFDAEPRAELIRGRLLPAHGVDGNFTWGKSPRRLHVEKADHPAIEFNAWERMDVPRAQLLAHAPDDERKLTEDQSRVLGRWIAKRYDRAAFPDSFNDRVRPIQSKLRKELKKPGLLMLDLYIVLHSEDELGENEEYRVVLRAVMAVEAFEERESRESCNSALLRVSGLLDDVDGIKVIDENVVPASDMSLDDLRFFKRWDYDDLSLRLGEARDGLL